MNIYFMMELKFLLSVCIIIIIIVICYILFKNSNDDLNGFWIGDPKFLDRAKIYYLGADFSDGKLSIIIKPTNTSESITQTYTYLINNDTITINGDTSSAGEYILPNIKLIIKNSKNKLSLVDDETVYLILIPFNKYM